MVVRVFGTEDLHVGDRPKAVKCQPRQRIFPRFDGFESKPLDVADGSLETHRAGRVHRSGLEFVRQFRRRESIQRDRLDHFPAGQERRHLVQKRTLSVQHADAHRAQHLMAGENEEIRVQSFHVDRNVRHALRTVDDGCSARGMRLRDEFFHRIQASQHVGNIRDGKELRAFRDDVRDLLVRERTVRLAEQIAQHGALPLCQHLPRQHVGVMLHDGHDDLVALMDEGFSVAHRDEIRTLRRVPRENDLIGAVCMNEARHACAGAFIGLRRPHAQIVESAERIGVVFLIKTTDRLDHFARLL